MFKRLKKLVGRTSLASVAAAAFVTLPSRAQAMDFDYHWNFARLIFLSTGMKPEFANRWAAASQMIDESKITTPMFLERQRRLFHFPQELIAEDLPLSSFEEAQAFEKRVAEAAGQEWSARSENRAMSMNRLGQKDDVHGQKLGVLGGVIRDNPFAYNLALYTILRGQELSVGSAFHVHADSHGHAKYSAALGHANAGHGPDRPSWHWENYQIAIRSQIELMAKFRHLLPKEMFDENFKLPGMSKTSLESSPEEIFDALVKTQDVQALMAEDVLRAPEYTKFVLTSLMQALHKMGVIENVSALHPILSNDALFNRGKDAYEILTEVIVSQLKLSPEERAKTFNLQALRNQILASATLGSNIDELIKGRQAIFGEKALLEIATQMATNLLDTQVPRELSNEFNFLVEKANPFRELEMSTRLENMQKLSERFTGTRSYFTTNKPAKVMAELIDQFLGEMAPELALERLRTTQVVGFSRGERVKWSLQMIRYWLVDLLVNIRLQNGFKTGGKWYSPLNWVKETEGSHMRANPLTIALMNNEAFEAAMSEGKLKQFVTPAKAAKIEAAWKARQVKLQAMVTKEFRKRGHVVADYDMNERAAHQQRTRERARSLSIGMCKDIFRATSR